MAVLNQSVSMAASPFELSDEPTPPRGTFVARCIDCRDEFGVERRKFQSEETEKVDVTSFLFGIRDAQGSPFRIATRRMKISANKKSALFEFLKSWLGEEPKTGWDYAVPADQGGMVGRTAIITVVHTAKRDGDGVWADIQVIAPAPAGMPVGPLGAPPVQAPRAPVEYPMAGAPRAVQPLDSPPPAASKVRTPVRPVDLPF